MYSQIMLYTHTNVFKYYSNLELLMLTLNKKKNNILIFLKPIAIVRLFKKNTHV